MAHAHSHTHAPGLPGILVLTDLQACLPSVLPIPTAKRTWGNFRWLLMRSMMFDKETGSFSVHRRPIPVWGRGGCKEIKIAVRKLTPEVHVAFYAVQT